MANWWESGGASGAVGVYQPIGAADPASSYSNLANPGTYDAAPGTAPTWAQDTGWTFNGSTQWLDLGGHPADQKPCTYIVRFTMPAATGVLRAPISSSINGGLMFDVRTGTTAPVRFLRQSLVVIGQAPDLADAPTPGTSHVYAITYGSAGAWEIYKDGASVASGTNNQTPASGATLRVSGQAGRFFRDDIAAIATYNTELGSAAVAAVSAAAAALDENSTPGGGQSPVPLILQAHHEAGWL